MFIELNIVGTFGEKAQLVIALKPEPTMLNVDKIIGYLPMKEPNTHMTAIIMDGNELMLVTDMDYASVTAKINGPM